LFLSAQAGVAKGSDLDIATEEMEAERWTLKTAIKKCR